MQLGNGQESIGSLWNFLSQELNSTEHAVVDYRYQNNLLLIMKFNYCQHPTLTQLNTTSKLDLPYVPSIDTNKFGQALYCLPYLLIQKVWAFVN